MNSIEAFEATKADQYLQRSYARVILPESDGTFRGEIIEFPGCIATGNTASETLISLEEVAKSWLLSILERGQSVPEPVENSNDFSGRLVLRIPKSLHKKATWIAAREGVSLNQFITSSLAEFVGERRASMNVYGTIYEEFKIRQFGESILMSNQNKFNSNNMKVIFPDLKPIALVNSNA